MTDFHCGGDQKFWLVFIYELHMISWTWKYIGAYIIITENKNIMKHWTRMIKFWCNVTKINASKCIVESLKINPQNNPQYFLKHVILVHIFFLFGHGIKHEVNTSMQNWTKEKGFKSRQVFSYITIADWNKLSYTTKKMNHPT